MNGNFECAWIREEEEGAFLALEEGQQHEKCQSVYSTV
jgi:hypothetical protein